MDENTIRLTDGSHAPGPPEIEAWIGPDSYTRWSRVTGFIATCYPGVFPENDWCYGGKKHGWGLRFKKSKAFCTLIPERNDLRLVVVLGAAERQKFEETWTEWSASLQELYTAATTYHDGKWLNIRLDDDRVVDEALRLLMLKRSPPQRAAVRA